MLAYICSCTLIRLTTLGKLTNSLLRGSFNNNQMFYDRRYYAAVESNFPRRLNFAVFHHDKAFARPTAVDVNVVTHKSAHAIVPVQ